MLFPTSSRSPQPTTTTPNRKSIFSTHNFRQLTRKILHKLKPSTKRSKAAAAAADDDDNTDPKPEPAIKEARFVTFIRPSAAPQIIDLQALKCKGLPQKTPPHIYRSAVSRSKAEIVSPDLRQRQGSLRAEWSSPEMEMEMGRPLLGSVLGLSSRRSACENVADYEGYELLHERGVDVDWSLLNLPEPVLRRLANESCHSLI